MRATAIINANCSDALARIASDSVDCIVTSPPYWGLRDYGVAEAIGLEATLQDHLAALVGVFEECRRVLEPTGTLWLNYGDAYAGSGRGGNPPDSPHQKQASNRGSRAFFDGGEIAARKFVSPPPGFRRKNLMGLPWRLAFALQDAGWNLRSDIVWAKPNPMPESVTDRPTRAHEYVFLFSKSFRYFYDAAAIARRRTSNEDAAGFRGGSYVNGAPGPRKTKGNIAIDKQRGHGRRHAGFNDRWDKMTAEEQKALGANARDVWEIAAEPFKDAHFATMPTELARRCIVAGCPAGGLVLDPFGGAGTTALAAERAGRRAILIELNSDYCALAEKRLAADRLKRGAGNMDDVARVAGDPMPLFAQTASG